MWHRGTLATRQTPGQARRRADKLSRRAAASGRTRRSPIHFERIDPTAAETTLAGKIHQEITALEARMRAAGIGWRKVRSIVGATAEYLRAVGRAAAIQRCGYQREYEVDGDTRRGAPCGGKLTRSGGLLTCRSCGRIAATA